METRPPSGDDHLTDIINNILSRRGNSTSLSATMSTLSAGTQGYFAGYDLSDYSGQLLKKDLDPITATPGQTRWDAGCILTGGFCLSTGLGTDGNPAPRETLRKAPFGRVAFANTDLAGAMDHRFSILEAQRAINQLVGV